MFKKSRFYPIISGIYDFYLLSYLLGTIFAIRVYLRQTAINPLLALSILPIGIILVFTYYLAISPQTTLRSPGELLVGRRIDDGQKVWGNPFGYNRWALFLVTFIAMAVASNTWDSLGTGYIYSQDELILRSIFLTLLAGGVVGIGQGQIGYIWFVPAYFAFYAWQLANAPAGPIPQELLQRLALGFLAVGALYMIVVLTYAILRIRKRNSVSRS